MNIIDLKNDEVFYLSYDNEGLPIIKMIKVLPGWELRLFDDNLEQETSSCYMFMEKNDGYPISFNEGEDIAAIRKELLFFSFEDAKKHLMEKINILIKNGIENKYAVKTIIVSDDDKEYYANKYQDQSVKNKNDMKFLHISSEDGRNYAEFSYEVYNDDKSLTHFSKTYVIRFYVLFDGSFSDFCKACVGIKEKTGFDLVEYCKLDRSLTDDDKNILRKLGIFEKIRLINRNFKLIDKDDNPIANSFFEYLVIELLNIVSPEMNFERAELMMQQVDYDFFKFADWFQDHSKYKYN